MKEIILLTRRSYMVLLVIALLIITSTGCSNSSTTSVGTPPTDFNSYTGMWESVYVYKSGYNHPIFFPVAIKLVRHTMTIKKDKTFQQDVAVMYVDDAIVMGSYSGSYTFSDEEIVLYFNEGIVDGVAIPKEQLPEPEAFIKQEKTLVSKEAYYAESPERDENNKLKFPIMLVFRKR